MKKNFEIKLPLSLKDSFEIVRESGNEISGWKLKKANEKTGFIEWKQSILSVTGSSTITVKLEESNHESTLATVSIYRPIQVWDPARICDRVFKKLERNISYYVRKTG